jgi:hypothetical protein
MIRGIVGAALGFLRAKEGGIASTAFGDKGGSSRTYCGLRPLRLAQGGGSSAPLMKLLVRSLMALSTTRQCSLRLSVNFTAIICHEDESELFHGHVRCRPGVLGVCPICIPAFCSKQWLREMHSGRCSLGSSLQFRVTKKLRPSSPAC